MGYQIAIETDQIEALLIALGIGLLLGLERERRPAPRAGLRTFALVGLMGALNGLLGQLLDSALPFIVSSALIGAMIIFAYYREDKGEEPGTTSVVALLLCHTLGFLVWAGYAQLAIMVAMAMAVLLYFKTTLHGWVAKLTPTDWISILQFGVLSLVILPVLPDENFGPFGALNPHQVWLMVVLISGVSLAGYAALKLVGSNSGAPLVGLFGGLVSSTATTLVFARHARKHEAFAPAAALVILLANLVMVVRVAIVAAAVQPALFLPVLRIAAPGLLLGAAALAFNWRRLTGHEHTPTPTTSNPTELRSALTFGALYAFVLFCTAWLAEFAGTQGLYIVASISGLTDVDAMVLSSLRLFSLDHIQASAAVTAIGLAMIANLAFKTGLAIVIGGVPLMRRVLAGMVVVGVGIAGALIWVRMAT